jgi:hypothetical protein
MGRALGDEGAGNAEYALIREARPAAAAAVRTLLDWARTRDSQPWLPPPHIAPRVVGPAHLVNAEGQMTHGYRTEQGVIVVFAPEDLPTGDVTRALEEDDVPEPESLLAEAQWAVWPTHDPDTKRAVLLAAIALEVKTPAVLRANADAATQRLLDLLFARHDETPMSVNFLLNQVAEVVLGRSLKHHDGIVNRHIRELFTLRNDVAHRGMTPAIGDVRTAVAAARRVFVWLDGHLTTR